MEEQIDILFTYHVMSPVDDVLKAVYRRQEQAKVVVSSLPEDELRRAGYTEEMIANMKRDLPNSLS